MADEIGQAFQRVGGSAGALGIEFEKISSWIAVLSSRTREGAGTIGNAIKSILARIQQLQEKGYTEEDNTSVNQVAKALATVGIQLMDAEGQFRNFGVVMDELGAKWKSLDSRTRAYLATVIAGTYQQSRFLNLMEGYSDTITLYEQALQAAGTTQQKFNQYQESTEAHLNRLKATLEGVWQNAFQSDDIRLAIDLLTSLLNVLDKIISTFGLWPTLIAVVTAAFFKFNTQANATLTRAITNVTALDFSFKRLVTSINLTSVAVRGLTFAFTALQSIAPVLIISGITYAITALIQKFIQSREETKKLSDEYKQNVQDIQNQIDELKKLSDEYEELNKKSQLLRQERERLNQIENELVEKYDVSISKINSLGNTYTKTTEAIYERIKALEEEKRVQEEIFESGVIGRNKEDLETIRENVRLIEHYTNEISKKEDLLKKLQQAIREGTSVELPSGRETSDKDYMKRLIPAYQNEISYFKKSLKEAQDNLKETSQDIFTILTNKLEEDLEKNRFKISDIGKEFISEIAKALSVSDIPILDSFNILEQVISKYNELDIDSLINKFNSLKEQFQQNPTEELEKQLNETSTQIKNGFNIIISSVDNLSSVGKKSLSEFIVYLFNLFNVIRQNKSTQIEFKNINEAIKKSFEEASDALKPLNQALNELSENHKLSTDTIIELVSKYPELLDYIHKTADGWTIETQAIENKRQAVIQSQIDILKAEQGITDAVRNELAKRLKQYGIELSAIKNLNDARRAAQNLPIIPDRSSIIYKKDNIKNQTFLDTYINFTKSIERNKIEKLKNDLLNFGEFLEKQDFLESLLNDRSLGVSKSKSNFAREEQKAEALEAIDLSQEEINAINAVIKARDKDIESLERQIKTAEKANDYNKAIQLTNQLIQQQELKLKDIESANQEIHKRAEAVRQKYASLGQQFVKNGILFEKWFDSSGQATEEYINYIESFEKKSQQIINSNLSEAEKKRQIDALKEQRDLAMYIFSILQRYKLAWLQNADAMRVVNDEIDALKEKNKEYYEEIRRQQEEIRKANEDLYDDWISEVEDLARNIVDIYKEVYEAQRDVELENIEKMIDAEEKRHEKRIKNIEDEYEKFERTINDMIKLIDREFEEQEYQDELASLQKEEAELLKQINQLALDDSIEAKARREELEKELADTRTEIEKLQRERTRDIRKQSLEDMLENKRRETEAHKEAENEKYEREKETLTKLKEERKKYWDNLINDESKFLQIESQIINGSIDNIIKDMDNFKNTIMSISDTIGEAIQKNIINKIENLRQQLQTVTKTKPSGANYYVPKTEYEKHAIEQMKKNSEKWSPDLPTEIRKKLEQENQIWGKSIGATYNAAEGRWYKNGLPLYHEGGLVGESNSPVAKALHKILNLNSLEQLGILRKGEFVISNPLRALNNLMNLRIPKIIPQTQVVSSGDTINLNVRIEKLVGDESGARTFFNIINSELKKRGK